MIRRPPIVAAVPGAAPVAVRSAQPTNLPSESTVAWSTPSLGRLLRTRS